jgi:hypothetical protein
MIENNENIISEYIYTYFKLIKKLKIKDLSGLHQLDSRVTEQLGALRGPQTSRFLMLV